MNERLLGVSLAFFASLAAAQNTTTGNLATNADGATIGGSQVQQSVGGKNVYLCKQVRFTLLLMVLLLASFPVVGTTGFCQESPQFQPGTPSFTPASNTDGIDNVNLVSGNVSIRIPIISYPQVGGKLRMNFFLEYNQPALIGSYTGEPSAQLSNTANIHYNQQATFGLSGDGLTGPGATPPTGVGAPIPTGIFNDQTIYLNQQPISFVCLDQDCGGGAPSAANILIQCSQGDGGENGSGDGGNYDGQCASDDYDGGDGWSILGFPVISITPTGIAVTSPEWSGTASVTAPNGPDPISIPAVLDQIGEGDGALHTYSLYALQLSAGTTGMTGDGSGYLPITPACPLTWSYCTANSFIDKDGVTYSFRNMFGDNLPLGLDIASANRIDGTPPSSADLARNRTVYANMAWLENRSDANGNTIVDGLNSWTDTEGRVIPHVTNMTNGNLSLCSSTATSASAWTVPGIDGGTLTYTVCFGATIFADTSLANGYQYTYYWGDTACTDWCPPTSLWLVNYPRSPGTPPATNEMLSDLILPNGSRYTFSWDVFGGIKNLTLPTGGSIAYSYTMIPWDICNPASPLRHMLSQRVVKDNEGNSAQWNYQWQVDACASNSPDINIMTTVTDPAGNDTVHQHIGNFTQPPPGSSAPQSTTTSTYSYDAAATMTQSGLVHEITQNYWGTGSSRILMKTTTDTLLDNPSPFYVPTPMGNLGSNQELYPGPPTLSETQWADGTSSQVVYTYVPSGTITTFNFGLAPPLSGTISWQNIGAPYQFPCQCVNYTLPATKNEYAFGPGTPGGLVRSTTYTYQMQSSSNGSAYLAANLFNLPSKVTVQDGSGNPLSQTTYVYDNNAAASQGAHGNLTSISRWVNTNPSAPLVTSIAYKPNGMAYLETDPYGNQTQVNSFQCNGLFPLQVTKAYNSATTMPENFSYGYDATCMKLESMTDPNEIVTKYVYNDMLDRLTLTKRAVGTPQESWTSYSYPSMTQVNIAQDQNSKGDGLLQSSDVYDGLGRNIHSTGTNGATVDTKYDLLGRVHSTSNSHYGASSSTDGTTTYTYDALSRKVLQVQSDGTSVLQWCYNGAVSSGAQSASGLCLPNASSVPNARWVDSIDETGRHWQHVSDALGRFAAVVEPNPSTGALGLETDYGYDALDNLLSVNQKGIAPDTARTRGFIYDSLSRLLTDTNSETGTNTYAYLTSAKPCAGDASLPCSKTDARGVAVQYGYDALNRLVQKGSPVLPAGSTPNYSYSCYQYDATSVSGASSTGNFVGRLTNSWTQIGSTPPSSFICPTSPPSSILSRRSILAYDPLGRIQQEQQCTKTNCTTGVPFTPSYSYDLAGNVLTRSNGVVAVPITLTNAYDSSGRLSTVTSSITQYPTSLFAASQSASSPGYSPAGGLMNATFGTGLTLFRTYDSRLRITGEIDTGNTVQPPTPGAATISITGYDQHQ